MQKLKYKEVVKKDNCLFKSKTTRRLKTYKECLINPKHWAKRYIYKLLPFVL
nr:MAG TPA: hypothetical protein [Caudoviricetes sp.]